ncbi:MAG: polysaccharide biosynthesis/export family protein [Paludibacteraceae bacterium]|nr:polysaccharide biosynthesis/export family protein [Paludibacteraceae bacterium]
MSSKLRIGWWVAVALGMASCVTPRRTHYLQEADHGIASYPQVYTPVDYRIQKNDELNIRVVTLDPESKKIFNTSPNGQTQSSNNSQRGLYTYTVYDDGNIDFPYLGAVSVEGKTTREAKQLLEKQLHDYVKDCSVEVRLTNSYFNLLTEAGAGRYPITKEKMTVFEALAVGGDLGQYSDRKRVKIIREQPDGTTTVKEFDLRSKAIIGSEYYYIQPNDILYVPAFKGQFFRINSFLTALGITSSTISFGMLVYTIVKACLPKK